jgi:hypothetical protein
MLADPDAITTLGASLRTIKSMVADEALTCGKEQISVVLR